MGVGEGCDLKEEGERRVSVEGNIFQQSSLHGFF